jgi:hypothetical protein
VTEKQFNQLLLTLERFAEKFEEATEALHQTAQVLHRQVTLLEKIVENTNVDKRLRK